MIGSQVFHDEFGVGIIIGISGTRLSVDFDGDKKMFVYPDAFGNFLVSADQELMT